MNTLALQNKQNFPLTTDALRFMQDAYSALEQLGKLGGDNYILTGCTVTGSSASAGWMVIGGKLVPFAGGFIQTNVRLVTTANTITVGTGTRDETVITAEFGTSTTPSENVPWATLNANRPLALVDASNRIKALETLLQVSEDYVIPFNGFSLPDSSYYFTVRKTGKVVTLYFRIRKDNPTVGIRLGRISETFRPLKSVRLVIFSSTGNMAYGSVLSDGFVESANTEINTTLSGTATWIIQ